MDAKMKIKYSKNNINITIDSDVVSKETFAEAVLASSLPEEKKEQLLKEAGIMNMLGFGSEYSIPEADFKNMWAKNEMGGQFSGGIINLKNAVERGAINGQVIISGLQLLAQSGSAAATKLLQKYQMLIDAASRGKNAKAVQDAQSVIAALSKEFAKVLSTKPASYLGTEKDRSKSNYAM